MEATVRRRLRRNHRTCHHTPTAPAASRTPRPSRIPRISNRTAQFLVIMLPRVGGGRGRRKAGWGGRAKDGRAE